MEALAHTPCLAIWLATPTMLASECILALQKYVEDAMHEWVVKSDEIQEVAMVLNESKQQIAMFSAAVQPGR
jgi:hypothetical protein